VRLRDREGNARERVYSRIFIADVRRTIRRSASCAWLGFMPLSHVIAWRTIDLYLDNEINRTLRKFLEAESRNIRIEINFSKLNTFASLVSRFH